jgi:hypothetical protein
MKGPGKYSAVETLIQPAFGLLCAQTCIRPWQVEARNGRE